MSANVPQSNIIIIIIIMLWKSNTLLQVNWADYEKDLGLRVIKKSVVHSFHINICIKNKYINYLSAKARSNSNQSTVTR